ncbi:MAG TPA: glycosyltransferase family 2 protein, partial [Clostridia bacterium]
NLGVRKAHGEYVLLLNNDTTVTPDFLQPLLNDMEHDASLGMVQPQIRSMIYPKLLDSVGSFFTSTGFLYHFGYMKPYKNKLYSQKMYAYSIKGACVLMRRKDYLALGGLDETFVCYVEETDLCHRVWLSGKKIIYEPKSIIYHYGGGDMQVMTKDYVTMYRSYKNRIVSYFKNLSIVEMLKTLPVVILFSEGFVLLTFLKGGLSRAFGAQLGILVGLLSTPCYMKDRNKIQKNIRKISDSQLMSYVKRNPRFSYYYTFFKNPKDYKD